MISLVCGVPALTVGFGAIILLLSYLLGMPVSSKDFYQFEIMPDRQFDRSGQVIAIKAVAYILPSPQLSGMLLVGACSAGLGIHLSRRRWPHRKVTTSAIGLIVCSTAVCGMWLLALLPVLGL
jgi:hypothetical protein